MSTSPPNAKASAAVATSASASLADAQASTSTVATSSGTPRAQQQQPPQQQQVPNAVMASLTVKIGDVSRTSRKQLAVVAFPFLLSEGFDVFRAKADSCTARELQAFAGERHVREDPAVYIRPGAHSKQAELVPLSDKNFEARVARSYRNFLKRKPGFEAPSGFACDVVTYVRKDVATRRHRPNAGHTTVTPGQGCTMGGYAAPGAHSAANGVEDNGSPYGEQLSGAKRQRPLVDLVHEGDGYKTVRVELNGSVVPLRVNVRDLLACFAVGPAPVASDSANGSSGNDDPLHGVGGPSAGSDASATATSVGML